MFASLRDEPVKEAVWKQNQLFGFEEVTFQRFFFFLVLPTTEVLAPFIWGEEGIPTAVRN